MFHPIACSARATCVSVCARPVSLCMAAAAAALVICPCVRSVCVRVSLVEASSLTISRVQGPKKTRTSPPALEQCYGGHRNQVLRKPRTHTFSASASASLSLPTCLPLSLLPLSLVESVGFLKATDKGLGKEKRKRNRPGAAKTNHQPLASHEQGGGGHDSSSSPPSLPASRGRAQRPHYSLL